MFSFCVFMFKDKMLVFWQSFDVVLEVFFLSEL